MVARDLSPDALGRYVTNLVVDGQVQSVQFFASTSTWQAPQAYYPAAGMHFPFRSPVDPP